MGTYYSTENPNGNLRVFGDLILEGDITTFNPLITQIHRHLSNYNTGFIDIHNIDVSSNKPSIKIKHNSDYSNIFECYSKNDMELTASLDTFYSAETSYLMNKSVESQVRFLKDTNDHYIWRPSQKQGDQNTILGVPVFTTNYMPNQAGKASILFGNFKQGYQVVERVGVNLLRDPFTEKPFVKFYTLRRVGGDVVDGRALKALIQA